MDDEWQQAEVRRFEWSGPALDTPVAASRRDRAAIAEVPLARRVKGTLLLMEFDGMAGGIRVSPVRTCTWGLDLAGQMGSAGVSPASLESAGCIRDHAVHRQGQFGGLLAAGTSERAAQACAFLDDPGDPNDPFGDFVCFYDGNRNGIIIACPFF